MIARFFLIFLLFCTPAAAAPRNFHPIEPGQAYRSGQPKELSRLIKKYSIKTIINLRGATPHEAWWMEERDLCEKHGVILVDIPFSAKALPESEALLMLYDAFATGAHPLLIHCEGGANRTGAAAALWRMTVLGESREAAAEQLSEKYRHSKRLYPFMDKLVEIYRPDRRWILEEYPLIRRTLGA